MNETLLPTVKVVRSDLPDGYMLINQEDFDPATQELYQEPGTVTDYGSTAKASKKSKAAADTTTDTTTDAADPTVS